MQNMAVKGGGKMTAEQEKLVTDNIPFVYFLFNKMYNNELKYAHKDDFISEGLLGLVRAAEYYDSAKGIKFNTFAAKCINNQFNLYWRKLRNDKLTLPLSAPMTDTLTFDEGEVLADYAAVKENLQREKLDEILCILAPRQREIMELKRQGYSQYEIAGIMKKSQPQISRMFREIYKEAREVV
jgi:RNA polymerase sporulation-specific sigma factor